MLETVSFEEKKSNSAFQICFDVNRTKKFIYMVILCVNFGWATCEI